ncbi:SAM-dependent DNA methyltransferase [Methylobacterium haplocladii]|uniref:Methyltransferase n=1 Tax=Methylobacterium haplocladii TaxID=1176176 RepID=A0A512IS73_9HYPH|nr:SAM-dependent DNA methyltransferase [Methylobacterium haplocladii]GEP00557.1 hypothetical protein MHA02_29440 [Methylobacterium haplocladii]GJD85470.1 hypothetical protein HPGCJGGD_3359 [Methylobacterium haplocladii]GLS57857.1 hypothetical protein GCM10007887_05130 [Methylobacterium haplocladii]
MSAPKIVTAGAKACTPAVLPGGARSIMGQRREPPDSLEFFPTPPWATRAFCTLLQERHLANRYQHAWDPACGQGHMSGPLQDYFGEVLATDVFAHGGVREPHPPGWGGVRDFLDDALPAPYGIDWLVTNPPFNPAAQFVLHGLELARVGVAVLVRTQWLATEDRYLEVFAHHPPTLIVQYAERVPMHRGRWVPGGSTATDYVWVVWVKERATAGFHAARDPAFVWLPPGQKRRFLTVEDIRRYAWEAETPLFDPVEPDGEAS